ncbi:MAG: type I-E CRISPR-associated protein Cse2/CasB [Burkholderiales bacterium]
MEEKKSTPLDVLFAKPLVHWWQGLEEDRATRAVLRRCASLDAVTLSDAYQRFYRYMLACGWPENASDSQKDKLAAIAGLLVHVKADDTQPLPIKMSELAGDRPLVSELRFRDLLKVETTDDLFISLRRTLPLMGYQASIEHLAHDVYWWNDDTRKKWAYSYRWPAKPSA